MKQVIWGMLAGGVLAVVVLPGGVSGQGAKDAAKAITELADSKGIETGKVDAKKMEAIKKQFPDLDEVMNIYRPQPKPGGGKGESIEVRLDKLGSRAPLSPAQLQKDKEELMKLARLNIAMAELAKHYPPDKPKKGKFKKEWDEFASEMKKASVEMHEAVKKGDSAGLKRAASNASGACTKCHEVFRD